MELPNITKTFNERVAEYKDLDPMYSKEHFDIERKKEDVLNKSYEKRMRELELELLSPCRYISEYPYFEIKGKR